MLSGGVLFDFLQRGETVKLSELYYEGRILMRKEYTTVISTVFFDRSEIPLSELESMGEVYTE